VLSPTDATCGTFGGACVACSAKETCQLGACAPAVKKGCSCSELEGLSAMMFMLLALLRRRPVERAASRG
jgi:uncharacterized protein (TIGR03382 family)